MSRPSPTPSRALALAALALAASAVRAQSALEWRDLAPLPDAVGFGGPLCGAQGDLLIVAGGANFPERPPWEGGAKVWHDSVFALDDPDGEWRRVGALRHPLAYAAVVSRDDGIVVLGGDDGARAYRDAFILRVTGSTLEREDLPPLPQPSTLLGACRIDDVVYAAAGQTRVDDPTALHRGFWRLDLARPAAERRWEILEPWPGPPRVKTLLVAQTDGAGRPRVFLVSGETPVRAADGAVVRAYHRDGFRFAPDGAPAWTRIADCAVPVAAGTAVAIGQSHVLAFSGSTGAHVALPTEEQPPFPTTVRAYHTITDSWAEAGEMPLGVVTTRALWWRDRIVIPSGETRPGVRTTRVQAAVPRPPSAGFDGLDVAVLVAYLAGLVGMGLYFARRGKGTADYFVAGRRIPWWAAGLSIYATQLSAITFLSVPALAYATDWLVVPGMTMILAMAPIVVCFYLPFFRRLDVTTAYEYLERRFHVAVRLVGSASFVAFQLARMAIVVYLPALALAAVTGIEIHVCILLMGVLATLYTALGGMEAVVWTDVLQVAVLLGGMLSALVIVIVDRGGIGPVLDVAAADGKLRAWNFSTSTTGLATWSILLGNLLLQFGPYTTDQAVVQRYLTTRDEKAAARGIWLNGVLSVPFACLFFALGTAFYAFFKGHPEALSIGMKNDEVFPLFVAIELPSGLAGLVIAGVFAASMSSLDSSMHSVATAITTDFYRRFRPDAPDRRCLRFARALTVGAGAFGTGVALLLATFDITSLLFLFQTVLGLLGSGLVAMFALGIFTRRANSQGVLIGAAASVAALWWVTWHTQTHFYLYPVVGIGTAVLVGYVASLAFPPPAHDLAGVTWRSLPAREPAE